MISTLRAAVGRPAAELFRRHVAHRAEHGAFLGDGWAVAVHLELLGDARETEVEDLDPAV